MLAPIFLIAFAGGTDIGDDGFLGRGRPNAMAPDTADLDQLRTGERREGAIFGIFVFVQQTGFAVGGFVLSLFLAAGAHAGVGSGVPQPSTTAVLLTFTLASAALYGGAFAAILPYRMLAAHALSSSR